MEGARGTKAKDKDNVTPPPLLPQTPHFLLYLDKDNVTPPPLLPQIPHFLLHLDKDNVTPPHLLHLDQYLD